MAGRTAATLGLALVLAGCQFADTPPAPSLEAHGDYEWDINPPPTVDRPFIVGCSNVVVSDCTAIVDAVLAAVPAERRSPTVVEIELFCTVDSGHDAPATCPPSLTARAGVATIEFADGIQPLQFEVSDSVAGPTVKALHRGECPPFCWELSTPMSPKVAGAGPFEFEVGHCGLNHFNDFDGSFWVVAGFVSGDRANPGPGRMHVIDHDTIFYRHQPASGGEAFFARLERLPGQKFIWQWCA